MTAHKWHHFAFLIWVLGVTTPVVSANVQPQILDVYQYFVNRPVLVRTYTCSEREHECLEKDKILFEEDRQCYTVGERGPCQPHEIFHVDKAETDRLGGHLRGTCATGCEDNSKSPLAATGECMSREEVESQVCRRERYLTPAKDLFGQWVCKWSKLPCSLPVDPQGTFSSAPNSKPYTGGCIIPDLFWQVGTNDIEDPAEYSSPVTPEDHPWLQFFPNKSYLNREFPCTEDEKICLQFGRVLYNDGNCYSPGAFLRECDGHLHIDWDKAMDEGGTLRLICGNRCPMFEAPQGEMRECTSVFTMMRQICRWNLGLRSGQDAFGTSICQCREEYKTHSRPPPSLPPPASSREHCRAPDFSNPIPLPSYDKTLTLGFRLPCSEEEFECLREGRVLAGGACHALRTQGPCAKGEELLLDKEALAHQRLAAVCKARPCPEDSVRLPTDGQCITIEKVKSLLCPREEVDLDEFGGWQCDFYHEWPGDFTRVIRHSSNSTCELPAKYPYRFLRPYCPVFPLRTELPSASSAISDNVLSVNE